MRGFQAPIGSRTHRPGPSQGGLSNSNRYRPRGTGCSSIPIPGAPRPRHGYLATTKTSHIPAGSCPGVPAEGGVTRRAGHVLRLPTEPRDPARTVPPGHTRVTERSTNCTVATVSAPEWIKDLLGWKNTSSGKKQLCVQLFGFSLSPNISDTHSTASIMFAGEAFKELGIPLEQRREDIPDKNRAHIDVATGISSGRAMEVGIAEDLDAELKS